jgi:hypothetical protein
MVAGSAYGSSAMPWELWRQDELGNEFLIRVFDDRAGAERGRDEFIARGHHQHYWVRDAPANGPNDGGGDSAPTRL